MDILIISKSYTTSNLIIHYLKTTLSHIRTCQMGIQNVGSIHGDFNFAILDTSDLQGDLTGLLLHIESHITGGKSSIIIISNNQSFYTTSGYTIFPPNGDLEIFHTLLRASKKKGTSENHQKSIEIKDLLSLPLPTYPSKLARLSRKQCEVFKLLLTDLSSDSIEKELYIARSTLKTHISNIYKKIEVSSRNELTSKYRYLLEEIETLKVIQDNEESIYEQNYHRVCS